MATFKCKMCGGTLEINSNDTVATCEYCGTRQTLPRIDDDRKASLHDRASHLRRSSEYDKAMAVYEQLLNVDSNDAEVYWSLVLCRYGIEYVEDPASGRQVPTVNRVQFTSIFDDENYRQAIIHADSYQKAIYEEEAKAINDIQKRILAISEKEEPFDVFICYKETDSKGRRTPDSVLANDLYHQLVQEGFKVFFARITLEDKLGSAYEPYIFAALNSAKVMVVLGTKPEYFNAVWVRNEWSRFLSLIKQGQKKVLVPAYRNMDPYDLPEEFSHLQAQDMSKLGFMQDLIRGIRKILQVDEPKSSIQKQAPMSVAATNVAPLMERAFIFLEDGEWESADEYCERVLDTDPRNAEAYLGKLMAELHVKEREELKKLSTPLDANGNYQKAMRFAKDDFAMWLEECNSEINYRNADILMEKAKTEMDYLHASELFVSIGGYRDSKEKAEKCKKLAEDAKMQKPYDDALLAMNDAKTDRDYRKVADLFESLLGYRNSNALAKECLSKAEEARKDSILLNGKSMMTGNDIRNYENAIDCFASIADWKDASEMIDACQKRIEEIKAKVQVKRLENARIAKRNKKIAINFVVPILCAIIAFVIVLNTVIVPNSKYNDAIELMEAGNYSEAISAFEAMDGYKDSISKIEECNVIISNNYNDAIELMEAGNYSEAISAFEAMDGYKDSLTKIDECKKAILAIKLMEAGNLDEAYSIFVELGDYKDAASKAADVRLLITKEQLKSIKVGSHISFGTYEQDGNTSNGNEDIEWIVLEVRGNKALVISKYALDCKLYNEIYTDVTWETCTLRKWLNSDFINVAFSADEKAMIPTVTVYSDKKPDYLSSPGNATQDQVFLLNITEANKYFSYNSARMCDPTDFAAANGVDVYRDFCRWWLRSPGLYQDTATFVDYDGGISRGGNVDSDCYAVRPALWISLE